MMKPYGSIQSVPLRTLLVVELYCYFKDKKDYDAPIADFTRGIELNPYDICGYCGRVLKYGSIGQTEKANQDFQMVRQLGREEIDSPMIYMFIRGRRLQ